MTKFYSKSTGGFYDEGVHGARKLHIADSAWVRPVHDVILQPGESCWVRDGEVTANTSEEPITLTGIPDWQALAPTVEIDNPDCKIPVDAVEISDEQWRAALDGQSQGNVIQADSNGLPVALPPPPPTFEHLAALTLAKAREQRQPIIGVLDGMQSSALTKGDTVRAEKIEDAKQALKDITKLDLSGCVTADDMKVAILTRYKAIAAALPDDIRQAFASAVA